MVREQIEVLANNFPIAAIKTGLLCSGRYRRSCGAGDCQIFRGDVPLVIDPVIIATSGEPLVETRRNQRLRKISLSTSHANHPKSRRSRKISRTEGPGSTIDGETRRARWQRNTACRSCSKAVISPAIKLSIFSLPTAKSPSSRRHLSVA